MDPWLKFTSTNLSLHNYKEGPIVHIDAIVFQIYNF